MSQPQLYMFAISHYCEKARWALDYLGVDYAIQYVAPGMHADLIRGLGANGSALPFLASEDLAVQGSQQILEWAQDNSGNGLSLTPVDLPAAREIEERLDDVLGVHVRRMIYCEALIEHPEKVLPIFTDRLADNDAQFVRDAWEVITATMIQMMDLGTAQWAESRQLVLEHLDWLDESLDDGRTYLTGERFSRVDLSAAALLAPLVIPPEHPTYGAFYVPPRLARDIADWRQRPVMLHVASMYRQYRNC